MDDEMSHDAPTVDSMYQYNTLRSNKMRLMRILPGADEAPIRITLHVTSVDRLGRVPYSALSYAWGKPSQRRHIVTVNNAPFEIRHNLYTALRQFRSPDTTKVFWIDAICINQDDKEEKISQLPLMSDIYSKAHRVEIWLGPALRGEDKALAAVCSGELVESYAATLLESYFELMKKEWFGRLWVVQELCLAAPGAAHVNCDSTRWSWQSFHNGFARFLNDLSAGGFQVHLTERSSGKMRRYDLENLLRRLQLSTIRDSTSLLFLGIVQTSYTRRKMSKNVKDDSTNDDPSTLGNYLYATKYARTSEARDKVLGLCGILPKSTRDLLLASSNKSAEDVYHAATMHILRYDSLPNRYLEFPTVFSLEQDISAPSWTLDFSSVNVFHLERSFPPPCCSDAPGTTKYDIDFIEDNQGLLVNACIIDRIKDVQRQEVFHKMPEHLPDLQRFWLNLLQGAPRRVLRLWMEEDEQAFKTALSKSDVKISATLDNSTDPQRNIDLTAEACQLWKELLCTRPEFVIETFTKGSAQYKLEKFLQYVNLCIFLHKVRAMIGKLSPYQNSETHACLWSVMLGDPTQTFTSKEIDEELDLMLGNRDDMLSVTVDHGAVESERTWANTLAEACGIPDFLALSLMRCSATGEIMERITNVLWHDEDRVSPTFVMTDRSPAFFMTDRNLSGMALPMARPGDQVAILFKDLPFEMPFVLRPERDGRFSMVCPAIVSDNWAEVCKPVTEKIVII